MNDVEQIAEQIAAGGRDALIARLRPAFERAAAAHADVLEITPEQLHQMVQDAAGRADGLQWRRALAAVACDQLGLELGEALRHPAVTRAQEILGVPSYEEALGRGGEAPQPEAAASRAPAAAGRPPGAAPQPRAAAPRSPAVEPESPPAEGSDPAPAAEAVPLAEPVPAPQEAGADAEAPQEAGELGAADVPLPPEDETQVMTGVNGKAELAEDEAEEIEEADYEEETAPVSAGPPATVHIPAIHVGGIANLNPGEAGLELRFADPGVDIAREGDVILGRIAWREIKGVDVGSGGRLLRRRKDSEAKLVIRTERGDASFRIPGTDEEALRGQLAPALVRIPAQS